MGSVFKPRPTPAPAPAPHKAKQWTQMVMIQERLKQKADHQQSWQDQKV